MKKDKSLSPCSNQRKRNGGMSLKDGKRKSRYNCACCRWIVTIAPNPNQKPRNEAATADNKTNPYLQQQLWRRVLPPSLQHPRADRGKNEITAEKSKRGGTFANRFVELDASILPKKNRITA